MSIEAMRQATYDRLITEFPKHYGSSVKIGFENHAFEQPRNEPHMMAELAYTKTNRASIGTVKRFSRIYGLFIVDCIVPEKSGTATVNKMADAVRDSFVSVVYMLSDGSWVTTQEPYVAYRGKVQDGFYIVTTITPFYIDSSPER